MIYKPRTDPNLPLEKFSVTAPTPYGEMRLPASCQVITPAVINTGMWAPEECLLVQTLLREGDTMLDIGAHCGFLTLAGAHAAGPKGQVISVEPTPQTARILRDNAAQLSPAPVEVIEAAAWSESGKATMSLHPTNTGDNRAYSLQGEGHEGEVEIERVALDLLLLPRLDRLDLVKMDTQGSEPHAVAGMQGLLQKFRPVMIMEYWPPGIRQGGEDPRRLLGRLRALGYQIRVPGAIGFGDATDELINEIALSSPGEHISIMAVPGQEKRSLTEAEAQVFSQNGEDGVIAELVRRVGAPGRFFVEFGAEEGSEGNCALLAEQGWSGVLIEGSPESFSKLQTRYQNNPKVETLNEMITADNLQDLLSETKAPQEIDLFSIDIDSNDYWVWQSLADFSPRILVIEYNAQMGPERQVVMPRNDAHQWDGTDYYGASVAALRRLGEEKGYTLVHTDSCGVNAFFVRNDLAEGLPQGDDVTLHPANHFHTGKGHPRDPQDRPWLDLESGQEVRLGQL